MLIGVEKVLRENIVVITYAAPFEPERDLFEAQIAFSTVQEIYEGEFCRVDDVSLADLTPDQIDLITGSLAGRGMLVGNNTVAQVIRNTPLFNSLDDALAFARERVIA